MTSIALERTDPPYPEGGPLRTKTDSAGVLKMAVRRLTSRAALIRQSSAALLRRDTTPSLLRKTSAINLFPELDDARHGPGVQLYYYTGWEGPNIHWKAPPQHQWTELPGTPMVRLTPEEIAAANLPSFEGSNESETIWMIHVQGVEALEFVPNFKAQQWDKAPGNVNYKADEPGRYVLRHGRIRQLVDPPSKPALLKACEVGSTEVTLVWNPPIVAPALVAGYRVYRDNCLITTVGENESLYKDVKLLGLTKYTYTVRAINKLDIEGPESERVTVETGEPGKPSAPQCLQIVHYSKTCMELQWQVPADNGGRMVFAYNIYRNGRLHGTQKASTGLTETFRDVKEVLADNVYVYHVTALNKEHLQRSSSMVLKSSIPDGSRNEMAVPTDPTADMDKVERASYYRLMIAKQLHPDEGILSESCEGKAITMVELPRINDQKTHVILQGFNWVSCKNKNGWYEVLSSKVELMKESNISMLWLPPPAQSVSDEGYMPTRWYDLNTRYGTQHDLKALNQKLIESGVVPMLDLVVNHRCGTKRDKNGDWSIFEDPDWESWAIVANNVQGYYGGGSQDTGAQSDCAPDIDHTNNKVREDIRKWTKWIFEEIGFGTIRIDMAPGYSVGYQVEYVEALGSPFAVGEYWSGDPNVLQNYTSGGRGRIAAFDFALYYILRRCVESNNFEEMSNNGRLQGLLGRDPERAVTFLDNHDTEHLNFVGKFGGGNGDMVLRGYAYLLTHPGTPCVYWNHWADYGEYMRKQLMALTSARKRCGIISLSGVCIDRAQWGLYAAYIARERHCNRGGGSLAVKIGSGDWRPEGGNWEVQTYGNGYCVWGRT